ncbi:hypothetical protein KP509_03G028900 [Ceratopteris richardii]|uniref:Secreted protein n=1 Tax=Ceratopteris richardii TaxID=49495 RepID=A0A8T2V649_CERRI|nr:hypothetical protein KP509_03G028900 [Ceratopteris richardii]
MNAGSFSGCSLLLSSLLYPWMEGHPDLSWVLSSIHKPPCPSMTLLSVPLRERQLSLHMFKTICTHCVECTAEQMHQ